MEDFANFQHTLRPFLHGFKAVDFLYRFSVAMEIYKLLYENYKKTQIKTHQNQETLELSSEISKVNSTSSVSLVTMVTGGNFLLKYTLGSVN